MTEKINKPKNPSITKTGDEKEDRHVVLLIHGIRTQGEWADRVRNIFAEHPSITETKPVRYGFLDVLRFLVPGPLFKRKPFDVVFDAILGEQFDNSGTQVSVIAHSFGAYIVAKILQKRPYVRLFRLLLCGSVLTESFPWRQINTDQLNSSGNWRAVNDCGEKDIWPILAKNVSVEYGSSGRLGFGNSIVRDRFFSKKHSEFFLEKHIRDYWLPYISDGIIIESKDERVGTHLLTSWINLIRIPVILVVGALFWGSVEMFYKSEDDLGRYSDVQRVSSNKSISRFRREAISVDVTNRNPFTFELLVNNGSTQDVVLVSNATLILGFGEGRYSSEPVMVRNLQRGNNLSIGANESRNFVVSRVGGWGGSDLFSANPLFELVSCEFEYKIGFPNRNVRVGTISFECPTLASAS